VAEHRMSATDINRPEQPQEIVIGSLNLELPAAPHDETA